MENAFPKIKSATMGAPIGAVGGAVVGYLISKSLGYHKTITVLPFMVVGTIIGASVGAKLKSL